MKYITFLLLLSFFFFSCQKEKTGCTDSAAVNFDATAEVEDGTCRYCGNPIAFSFITYADKKEDTSDYELDVVLPGDIKVEEGCKYIIDITDFCYCLEYSEITWTPAEIFDCSSCAKVTLTPTESVEVTLKIDNIDGYYFSGSFGVFVPD